MQKYFDIRKESLGTQAKLGVFDIFLSVSKCRKYLKLDKLLLRSISIVFRTRFSTAWSIKQLNHSIVQL